MRGRGFPVTRVRRFTVRAGRCGDPYARVGIRRHVSDGMRLTAGVLWLVSGGWRASVVSFGVECAGV
jgi:hypothetical protein